MSGKVVVITGASSGIGAATAKRLTADGHSLVLAARRADKLAAVAAECGGQAVTVTTDVCKRGDVARLRDQAIAAFGQVDVWLNNAGRGINREVTELSDEDFDEMMLVNTKSALYGMQAIVPHFKARGTGHVINVSSMLTRLPTASFRAAYSAAKSALNALTAALRQELLATHPGIRVSLIIPGSVPGEFQAASIGGTPAVNPPGAAAPQKPEDIAEVVAEVIRHPVPEAYTRPEFEDVIRKYYEDVAAFELARVPKSS
jgi:NADP-dependent 3-hydroxy acid dehydrogenase YdfG